MTIIRNNNRDREADAKGQNNNDGGPRINENISAGRVRVVGPDGEMIGVLSRRDALQKARDYDLDLVEVSPNADPPVCKILDYGKFKFEEQKRKAEAKKKQKVIEIKEVKLRPMIDKNDYNVKMRMVQRFIAEGNKVKITLRYRGREMDHQDLGAALLDRVVADVADYAKVEFAPKLEGKQVTMVLAPK